MPGLAGASSTSRFALFASLLVAFTQPSYSYSRDFFRKVALEVRQEDGQDAVPFSSAVSIEAAVSTQLAQITSALAIPFPSPTDDAEFSKQQSLRALATLMPPVPAARSGESDDFSHMIAQLAPSTDSNNDQTIAARQGNMRVMAVGDSISHGQEGDWTWRYRFWEWMQSQGVPFQFVGPYKGTMEPTTKNPGPPQPPPLYNTNSSGSSGEPRTAGGYNVGCASGFVQNSQHFSVWGRAAATDVYLIADVVRQYPTDLMLLMLGFNDLGWFYSDASGTIKSIATMIKNARSVNPNMKFAVANVVQRTDLGRDDLIKNTNLYNDYLKQEIPKWSTTQSPVVLVDARKFYTCDPSSCTSAYDGLHPNSLGEYQIAAAFSDGLVNGLKIGRSPLTVPSNPPARDVSVPNNFKAISSPQGVTATWDAVYGAYGYDIQSRVQGQDWPAPGSVMVNRFDLQWAIPNTKYEMRVRTRGGDNIKGDWTAVGVADTSNQQTCAPPEDFKVSSTSDGFVATWSPPKGRGSDSIVEYNVIYFDLTDGCGFLGGAAFKSSPARVTGLNSGHRYLIGIEVWNAAGEGLPLRGFDFLVGGSRQPPPPNNVKVQAMDGASAYVTWDSSNSVPAYRIWKGYRDDQPIQYNGSQSESCMSDYFLFPGVANYCYSINSVNGNDEGPRGPCVRAPQPNGDNKLTCPAAPAFCPGGGARWGPAPENPGPAPDFDAGQNQSNGSSSSGVGSTATSSNGANPTDVFVDPTIYAGKPTASCVPPCNFIFPPMVYSTVMTPPLWTTSFEFAYPTATSVDAGRTRTLYYITLITTTITLPPTTQTAINIFNYNFTNTMDTTYPLTASITLPPITITKPNPPPGVTTISYSSKTRRILPPVFINTNIASSNRPQVTLKPTGPPGPICRTGCGTKCTFPRLCGSNSGCANPFGCAGSTDDGTDGKRDPDQDPDDRCSTSAVSTCTYSLSYATNAAGSTTSTSTSTSCATTSGCSVTNSKTTITPTPTPGPTRPFVVWPSVDGPSTSSQNRNVSDQLSRYVQKSSDIQLSESPYDGVNFWRAPLTDDQARQLRSNPNVKEVSTDCGCAKFGNSPVNELLNRQSEQNGTASFEKRFTGDVNDVRLVDTNDRSLQFVSLPPNRVYNDIDGSFAYHKSAGQGSIVYLVDSGLADVGDEFTDAKNAGRVKWLYTMMSQSQGEGDIVGHGTNMASKIIGKNSGVAKLANLAVVRLYVDPSTRVPMQSEVIEAISKSCDDQRTNFQNGVATTAVLSLSLYFPAEFDSNGRPVPSSFTDRLRLLLGNCANYGMITVACSGNEGTSNVNVVPAAYARKNQPNGPLRGLIAVGALNQDGSRASLTNGISEQGAQNQQTIDIWAPGVDVGVNGGGSTASGTSSATAIVAGVAAYIIGLPEAVVGAYVANAGADKAARVRELMEYWGNQKVDPATNGRRLWNGINTDNGVQQGRSGCRPVPKRSLRIDQANNVKRQGSNVCTLPDYGPGPSYTPPPPRGTPGPGSGGGGTSTGSPPPATTTTDGQGRPCATSSGATSCTPLPPASPSQTSVNYDGSSMCTTDTIRSVRQAYGRYVKDRLYQGYVSYTYETSTASGATAIFQCDDSQAYTGGMWGYQIIDAFDRLYTNATYDNHYCGSSYLSNRCHVTGNYCKNCKDVGT